MNYAEHLLILTSRSAACVLISAFASVIGIIVEITSSAVGLKICVITFGIKMYKPIIKKKRKECDIIDC